MQNDRETPEKRRQGGKLRGVVDGKSFTKENQPSGAQKSAGWRRKKFTRDVLKDMLNMPYKFLPASKLKDQLLKSFGPDVKNMNIGQIMSLVQMNKSILAGDTAAFAAVLNQAHGFPKQQTDLTTKGKPVSYTPPQLNISVRQSDVPIAESEDEITG